jgi:hypothetical protein
MIDLSRLSRIVAMFDSPNVAERASAFARADLILRKDGQMWRDILPALYASPSIQLSGVDGGHIDQCRDMLRNCRALLTAWEQKFLLSISGISQLSDRQASRLETLIGEIELRREVVAEFGEA